MRRLLSLICGVTLSVVLIGQPTLTFKTHGFRAGDSHDFVFMKNNVNEGIDGPNVLWDFSDMQLNGKTLTSHMLKTSEVVNSNQIPSANFVLEEFGNFFYFDNKSSSMEQYGSSSGNFIIKYDKPFLKLKFPLTYGNKISGYYSGVQDNSKTLVPISGKYEIFADAYGTLVLPNNVTVDNVLRVKQTRTIDCDNGCQYTEITYRWYSADVRYPVLVIIKYITSQSTYVSEVAMYAHVGSHKKSATQISSIDNENINLYPNPFSDKLNIDYDLSKDTKLTIELFDNSGKLVKVLAKNISQKSGKQSYMLNADEMSLPSGMYYIKFTTPNDSFTKKILKQ